MGCCLSKKPYSIPLSSSDIKSPDPDKPDVNKPTKPVIELEEENSDAKPIISMEKVEKEEEDVSEEASKPVVVSTSSCTKEEVDALLIQCGKLSRSNSTRRYSGSKRSFNFDQKNERTRYGGEEGRKTDASKEPWSRESEWFAEKTNAKKRKRRKEEDPFSLLPSCVTEACSIVEAVEDLNSTKTTSTCLSCDLNQFRFTSTVFHWRSNNHHVCSNYLT